MAGSASIREARIQIIKADALDKYATSDQNSETSTTYVSAVDLTFTPPTAGEYLILASAGMQHDSTSTSFWVKLTDGTTDYGEMNMQVTGATTACVPWGTVVKLTLPASSVTLSIKYKVNTTGTTTYNNACIIALRVSAMKGMLYKESRPRVTTTSTTMQDKVSFTTIPSAYKQVVIMASGYDASSTSLSTSVQGLDGATTKQTVINEAIAAGLDFAHLLAYERTPDGTEQTFKTQYNTESLGTAGIFESAIAILQVEDNATVAIKGANIKGATIK